MTSAANTTVIRDLIANILANTTDPFHVAHFKMIERLSLLLTPKAIRAFPGPSDFEAIAQYLREAAEIMDDWSEAIGFQVADNSPYQTDPNDFRAVFSGAVTDAAYACTSTADRMRDDREAA